MRVKPLKWREKVLKGTLRDPFGARSGQLPCRRKRTRGCRQEPAARLLTESASRSTLGARTPVKPWTTRRPEPAAARRLADVPGISQCLRRPTCASDSRLRATIRPSGQGGGTIVSTARRMPRRSPALWWLRQCVDMCSIVAFGVQSVRDRRATANKSETQMHCSPWRSGACDAARGATRAAAWRRRHRQLRARQPESELARLRSICG